MLYVQGDVMNLQWTAVVEEDELTKELILSFPKDMLETAGWKDGDTLEWIDNNDGTWYLRKV